jgi:GNAT superfamily N-acetyltransferase
MSQNAVKFARFADLTDLMDIYIGSHTDRADQGLTPPSDHKIHIKSQSLLEAMTAQDVRIFYLENAGFLTARFDAADHDAIIQHFHTLPSEEHHGTVLYNAFEDYARDADIKTIRVISTNYAHDFYSHKGYVSTLHSDSNSLIKTLHPT